MDFDLEKTSNKPETKSEIFNLKHEAKPLVLFFYPKDNTPGCNIENQDFSALRLKFNELGFAVYGISRDKIITHINFKKKYNLKHNLISDPDEKLCNHFQVMKDKLMFGKKVRGIMRSTFILNEEKEIIKNWLKVKPEKHAQEVLDFIKSI